MLNGGSLDGAQILQPGTVATMGTNQIGSLSASALKTAIPTLRSDFSFVNGGRDKFGLGFLISVAPAAGHRSPGSLSWAGLANTWFWVDPARSAGGLLLSQMRRFADVRLLAAADAFERAAYGAPLRQQP